MYNACVDIVLLIYETCIRISEKKRSSVVIGKFQNDSFVPPAFSNVFVLNPLKTGILPPNL